MKEWKIVVVLVSLAAMSGPLAAQQEPESEAEKQKQVEEAEARMREAENALEEAARRIAELSGEQLARVGEIERGWLLKSDRPMIGITIDADSDSGPVEGVEVDGITPGGAAEEAGLLAGDVITAINGEILSAQSSAAASRKLLDFMAGVEDGDVLDVEYLRKGKTAQVELTPRPTPSASFSFNFDGQNFAVPSAPNAPYAPQVYAYRWMDRSRGHGFGDMELVELNESLGRYFGADSGLLVIKAPRDNAFKLQDGDVILRIDGREPKDLLHAVRILSSYEVGETVNIEIMRDKRKQTITVEVPDNRHSMLMPPEPVVAPAAVSHGAPPVRRLPAVPAATAGPTGDDERT